MNWLFAFLFVLALLPASSQAAECDLIKTVRRIEKFSIDIETFPQEQWQPCTPSSYAAMLMRAMDTLDGVQFEPFKANPFFQKNREKKDIVDFRSDSVLKYTDKISYKFQDEKDCGGKICAQGMVEKDGYERPMTLFTQFFSSTLSDMQRATVLVHEGRHTMASDPGHVTCTRGFDKGRYGGCDSKLSAGSGYGYAVDFMVKVYLFAKNVTEHDREIAREETLAMLDNRFNELDIDLKGTETAMIYNANGDGVVRLYDGGNFISTGKKFTTPGLFYARAGGRNAIESGYHYEQIPYDGTLKPLQYSAYHIKGMDFSSWATTVNQQTYAKWSSELRLQLKDMKDTGLESTLALFANRVEVLKKDEDPVKIAAPKGVSFVNFVDLVPACPVEVGRAGALVRDSKNVIWEFEPLGDKGFSRVDCKWPDYLQNYMMINGIRVGHGANGTLAFWDENGQTQIYGEPPNYIKVGRVKKMPGIFYRALTSEYGPDPKPTNPQGAASSAKSVENPAGVDKQASVGETAPGRSQAPAPTGPPTKERIVQKVEQLAKPASRGAAKSGGCFMMDGERFCNK